MLLFVGSCSWSLQIWRLSWDYYCEDTGRKVSDSTKVSVMMRTSVTRQQEKATHFESPSFLFIDLKRYLLLFIVNLFQNRQQAG